MSKYIFVSGSLKDTLMQAMNAELPSKERANVTWQWRRCGKIVEEVPIKIKKTMEEVQQSSLKDLEAALLQEEAARAAVEPQQTLVVGGGRPSRKNGRLRLGPPRPS